jgi:flagellar basal-body rod modification protein FlgD
MTVTPTSGATSAAGASSQVNRAGTGTGLDSQAFLKLLVAQLKYQDPMNPADSTEFMAQTAQFTMVEKLTALTQQSSDQLTSQRVAQAAQMVGRSVTYTDADGVSHTGAVSGARLLATGPVLVVDGVEVNLAAVTEITSPAGSTGSSTTSSTTGTDATSSTSTADPAAAGGTA